jgi:hypothetical protein
MLTRSLDAVRDTLATSRRWSSFKTNHPAVMRGLAYGYRAYRSYKTLQYRRIYRTMKPYTMLLKFNLVAGRSEETRMAGKNRAGQSSGRCDLRARSNETERRAQLQDRSRLVQRHAAILRRWANCDPAPGRRLLRIADGHAEQSLLQGRTRRHHHH